MSSRFSVHQSLELFNLFFFPFLRRFVLYIIDNIYLVDRPTIGSSSTSSFSPSNFFFHLLSSPTMFQHSPPHSRLLFLESL